MKEPVIFSSFRLLVLGFGQVLPNGFLAHFFPSFYVIRGFDSFSHRGLVGILTERQTVFESYVADLTFQIAIDCQLNFY